MKKLYPILIVTILLAAMSCKKSPKDYDLIGKKGMIEYPEVKAYVSYPTETELHWKMISKTGEETAGNETTFYKRLSDEWHFLNWIEKDGTTISQVINTKTGSVKTFWSFYDETSEHGNRSSMFLDGVFSLD